MSISSKRRWRKKKSMTKWRRYFVGNEPSSVTCHRVNQKVAVYGHWTREQVGALTCCARTCTRKRMCVHLCIFTDRERVCNGVCIYIYHAIHSSARMCKRDCYVRDVSDRKRDCERTGEGRKGRNRVILNDPEWNSPLRTSVEIKCGALQLRQDRARPRNPRVNGRVALQSCIWIS